MRRSGQVRMRMRIGTGLIAVAACCTGARLVAQETTVRLDGTSKGRVFDGLGAVSAGGSSRLLIDYPEPQRGAILDYLFKPGYGAALQHLKVEIGADVNSTDGSEPSHMRSATDHSADRGYEWWLMAEAHKRNPGIVLETLPWGAPRWVNPNPDEHDTLCTRHMAEYVADFIRTAKQMYGLDIAYTGVWNERVCGTAYIIDLHRRLQEEHLNTKIVCCDEDSSADERQWAIVGEIRKEPELASDIAVIGVHYPGSLTTTNAARETGKPLWSSEDQPNGAGGPVVARDWPLGGRFLAHLYNRNYLERSFTSTEIWSPITSYYDVLAAPNSGLMYASTPWSGHYSVQGAIWATAHTTQFARPGWRYLDSASGNLPDKGSYVSLRSPDRKDWSVVLESIDAKSTQKVTFRLTGGLKADVVHVWETNNVRTFEHVADINVINGRFEYTFDPDSLYSLTTTTGQGKGTAQPPPASAFPFPYMEDFEHTELGRTAKYLSDQDGAFEVHTCHGRPGRCLEQVITEKPIAWSSLPDPFTLAGDEMWTDYTVSADIRFLSDSPAVLMGRIDSSDVFRNEKARWPSGYILRVKPNGSWELISSTYNQPTAIYRTGTTNLNNRQWHRIALTFFGTTLTASLDGNPLASVEATAHSHGMIGLGTEWNHVQFDNLSVNR